MVKIRRLKYFLYALPVIFIYLNPLIELNNLALIQLLSPFTSPIIVGNTLFIPHKLTYFGIIITTECAGVLAIVIMICMIIIPRVQLHKKMLGILICVLLLFIGNLSRLIFIICMGQIFGPSIIAIAHFFSQGIIFLWMLFTWFFWLFFIVKSPR